MGYALIGTELSQFTGKVRAYLRWKGVDFVEQPATPEAYRDVIEPQIGYQVVPVLVSPDGGCTQDSAAIIEQIERTEPGPPVMPAGGVQQFVSLLFELYADEWLVIPAMHYRWSFDDAWILEQFGAVAAPDAPVEEKQRIGEIATRQVRDALPKYGVSDDTITGIQAHYEGFLADFSAHLRVMPYLFGMRPSLGDFALFGPMYGPLYRDPVAGPQMEKLAPLVTRWVDRLNQGGESGGVLSGDDLVPPTLYPILKRQVSEQLPVLSETARLFGAWAESQPSGARIPRSLGSHEFVIGGRRGERTAMSFSLWRLQRVLDHYQSLQGDTRVRADDLLEAIGGRALKQLVLPRRISRPEHRLILE